jgi:hypothetical protein
MGCRPCYGTIDSSALAARLRARSACARPQTSLIVSPKTLSSASIDRVPAKIVGIDVGISGFHFNLSSWFSLKFGILWLREPPDGKARHIWHEDKRDRAWCSSARRLPA